MNNPETIRQLIRVLAERELWLGTSADRVARSSRVVAWAEQAFSAGWGSASVGAIAGLGIPPDEDSLNTSILRLVEELELPLNQLLKRYERLIAEDIVEGRSSPRDGALSLYRFPDDLDRTPEPYGGWPRLCDALDLARAGTYGSVDEIEELIRRKARRLLEQENATR